MEKIIYSKWLALELRKRGFEFLRAGINPNYPQYNTYIFADTELLRQAITELTRKA